jgi:peptide/nickel transport system ATP-binding protein
MSNKTLIDVRKLSTYYFMGDSVIKAVDNISFEIRKGGILGLVGESGSGKSTVGLSIVRLVPSPGKVVNGEVFFDGVDLMKLNEEKIREYRGKRIGMVFQDPMTSLDPLMKIMKHLDEALTAHSKKKADSSHTALELLKLVGIPEERYNDYPHQFSGGMRQRVMIATAIAQNPDLVIADEPTTALDVIVQAQILNLFKVLGEKLGIAILYITHDVSVVMNFADRIAVMYGGNIVELAPTQELCRNPLHPYTTALFEAIPNVELEDQKLKYIPGNPIDPSNPPKGCKFNSRCKHVNEKCTLNEPSYKEVSPGHFLKCFLEGE